MRNISQNNKKMIEVIKNHISMGETSKALAELRQIGIQKWENEAVLIEARYYKINEHIRLNIISFQETSIEQAKINHAILDICKEIEVAQTNNKDSKNKIKGNETIFQEEVDPIVLKDIIAFDRYIDIQREYLKKIRERILENSKLIRKYHMDMIQKRTEVLSDKILGKEYSEELLENVRKEIKLCSENLDLLQKGSHKVIKIGKNLDKYRAEAELHKWNDTIIKRIKTEIESETTSLSQYDTHHFFF
jgi:Effector-associated domain 11